MAIRTEFARHFGPMDPARDQAEKDALGPYYRSGAFISVLQGNRTSNALEAAIRDAKMRLAEMLMRGDPVTHLARILSNAERIVMDVEERVDAYRFDTAETLATLAVNSLREFWNRSAQAD